MHQNPESGLIQLANGAWAWLAPGNSWGWSNAGLISDGEESLLVDTLYDLALTGQMLDKMRDAEPLANDIDTLVNTHANGDHCHGNELVSGAEIIASAASAAEMAELTPDAMAAIVAMAPDMGEMGRYFLDCFGRFKFDGITFTPPTKTFEGEMHMTVGDKPVELIEVGPAHTRGDILVHSTKDRVVYTGDILFIEGTPIIWEGPVGNWIKACQMIEAMDVDHIVPGHGPITDKHGVAQVRQYLEYVRDQARSRYDAGMDAFEAAKDIELAEYSAWSDPERIAVNVDSLYREFRGEKEASDVFELFARMAALAGYDVPTP
ncbi:MBL fold metallo-hydrolase [Halioglobus maricola]|uniref:MBL fold metallo-hydrolase n=1 Tax=Halioglobus maricola TaxID=2601894 RepID=A0A5P9NMR3_9GAMM|nr:MBL fold metallo-hydrolase [Halioglobus maricola]QFU76218.1 MBL fold metallo-hydrolase [Halioglobus maricola]